MRFLITGANGFVGKHLCAELSHRGQLVRAAVRSFISPGSDSEQAVVKSIDGDTDWTEALRNVDVVIHLAARAHVRKERAHDPLAEFLKVNLYASEKLAVQAAHSGVKRIVYVSTIGVNGISTVGRQPFSEQDEPDPQSPYAVSKWQTELALRRIHTKTGLEITVVRPPLVFGAEAPGNVAEMLRMLGKGMPLPLASVHNMRSFVYVKNLADALIVCATHPAASGQTYLVSDGEDVSTSDLLRRLGEGMGRPALLFPCPHALLKLAGRLSGKIRSG